jgi:hypothetical protein
MTCGSGWRLDMFGRWIALAEVWLQRGNASLAIAVAAEAVGLEPFRESGYRQLMRAHVLAGNRAEALRTYEWCVRILADEIGVEPDHETTALRDSLMQSRSRQTQRQTKIIAVTDIVGSTELTASLGDERWHNVLREHDTILQRCVEAVQGDAVKHLGDGFLLTFRAPARPSRPPPQSTRSSPCGTTGRPSRFA